MEILYTALAALLAYLVGSLSFAVIVSRAMGLKDPRSYGSHNPGATNVLRSGSKKAAVVTLILDGLKGWLPVVLVKTFGRDYGLDDASVAAVAFGAFLGHLFPVFFGFRGGKGVATAAGALLGIDGLLGLIVLATWVSVAYFTKYSSVASMAAAALAPLYYLLGDRGPWYAERSVLLAIFMISLLLVIRHKDNINKLMSGKESKLNLGKSSSKPPGK